MTACSALLFRATSVLAVTQLCHVCNLSLFADGSYGSLSLTTMSDYDFRPGGSLKLKGVAEGGIVKK